MEIDVRTAVTDLLGIEFPILAFTHCRDVVAAVTKAGGLGVLGAVAHTPEQLEIDLRWIEEEVGDKPYGVDLIVPAKYVGDEDGGCTLDDIRQLIPAEHQRRSSTTSCAATTCPTARRRRRRRRAASTATRPLPFSANRRRPAARHRARPPHRARGQRARRRRRST